MAGLCTEGPVRRGPSIRNQELFPVSEIVVKDFLDAGIHYGHRTSRWNPRMRPYIYGRRSLIHIIDIKETIRGLLRAKRYLQKVASQGSLVLFVGTKKQAADTIRELALSIGMPYVDYRWLGGLFTNFRTIRSRLKRLEELDRIFESGEIRTVPRIYFKAFRTAPIARYSVILEYCSAYLHSTPSTSILLKTCSSRNAFVYNHWLRNIDFLYARSLFIIVSCPLFDIASHCT